MKITKKIMVLLLSILMVIGTTMVTSFAEGGKTVTFTGGKKGHTYTLYQIFTGTVNTDGKTLENIQWGGDAPDSFKNQYATAAAAANAVAQQNDARAFAQSLNLSGNPTITTNKVTLNDDGTVTFSDVPEGYYVLVDTNGNTTLVEGDYSSAFVVEVVKDINGALKGSASTSDKKIKDKSGADAASDAAAYNIGDAVPFELDATTADRVSSFKKYHITFQDKQSGGLDAPTTFTVKVLGKAFTVPATGEGTEAQTTDNGTKITVTKVTPDSGNTFAIKVEFEPAAVGETPAATYLNSECNSKLITVEYTSVLNSSAQIGHPGNTNDMYITYSNNPESADGHEEGKTPDDTVKVFTYKTVVDKVDETGAPLEGAGFTIYMEVAEGTDGAQTGAAIKNSFTGAIKEKASALEDAKYYVAKQMTTVSGNNAQFEFKGLADGTYVIVETTVPAGYNPFQSKKFTISSAVTDTEITTLTGADPFTTTNPGADGAVQATKGNGQKHALDSGELYAEIEDNSGQELPSTGGMGTTILYIIGGALVVICGIMLVAKKRTGK